MAVLVTFADSRMRSVLPRVRRQAKKFVDFDRIETWTEADLDPEFVTAMGDNLGRGVRGFGYWSWKPQIILQALRGMSDGEFLVYVDAGCHLNVTGAPRLREYFDVARRSPSGILGFQLESHGSATRHESAWTKGDVLDFFDVRDNIAVTQSDQICGGIVVAQKRSETIGFFEEMRNLFISNFSLFDDSPSLSANAADFNEHRHDQSVFSLMAKLNHVATVSHSENYPLQKLPSGKLDWQSLSMFPIHARRDRGSWLNKKITRLAKISRRIFI
jgi:hypothetical protein